MVKVLHIVQSGLSSPMPRSKRKAVAARASATGNDFEKTKVKLGKRKRSKTLVDVSTVRSRKIYVPPQESAVAPRGPKNALPVLEYVARARDHFNTHARTAALTALARMYGDMSHCEKAPIGDAAPVLRVGLEALQDEEASVRTAGLAAILAILKLVRSVKPFAVILSSSLCAALSHIRIDIRVSAARAVSNIFELNAFSPGDVFSVDDLNPLPLLASMLCDLNMSSPKARAAAATAIAIVSSWNVEAGLSSPKCGGPFYYHTAITESDASSRSRTYERPPLLHLSSAAAGDVVVHVANMIIEYFPVRDAFGGRTAEGCFLSDRVLVAGARALRAVVCDHSLVSESAFNSVSRCVHLWAKEQVLGVSPFTGVAGATDVDLSMAHVAVALGEWDTVGRFVCSRLENGGTDWAADTVVCEILGADNAASHVQKEVGEVWLEFRWKAVAEGSRLTLMGDSQVQSARGPRRNRSLEREGSIEQSLDLDDVENVLLAFEHITASSMLLAWDDTNTNVWAVLDQVPVVVRRLATQDDRQGDHLSDDGNGMRDTARLCSISHRLLSVLANAVKVHGSRAPSVVINSVGRAVLSEILQPASVLVLLDLKCLALAISIAGYCGLAHSPTVLRLMPGKRGGWSCGSAAARVVEAWLPVDLVRNRPPDACSLEVLAAVLVSLSSAVAGAKRGGPPETSKDENTAREDVFETCTRIVRKMRVARDSIRAILLARGVSEAQTAAIIGRLCKP